MNFKLLVLILSKIGSMPAILSSFMDAGIRGTSIVDCEGMLKAIDDYNINPPPIFGSLRQYLNPGREKGKVLLTVMPAEKIQQAKAIIDKAVGGLDNPNTGICFTLPIDDVAGLSR